MARNRYQWDFFIAHAAADRLSASRLYELLHPRARVFMDSYSLRPGDDWSKELVVAQRRAAVTVVLISSQTEQAYYEREEIAAAIDLSRRQGQRVVPVYLVEAARRPADVPYGLRLKHALFAPSGGDLELVAESLLEVLPPSRKRAARRRALQSRWPASKGSPESHLLSPTSHGIESVVKSARDIARSWKDRFLSIPHLLAGLATIEGGILQSLLIESGIDYNTWTETIKQTITHETPDNSAKDFAEPTETFMAVLSQGTPETSISPDEIVDERAVLARILVLRRSYVAHLLGSFGIDLGSLEVRITRMQTPYSDPASIEMK